MSDALKADLRAALGTAPIAAPKDEIKVADIGQSGLEALAAQIDDKTISLSDSAAAQIAKILSGEAEGSILRVAVSGGGCSGFQYTFDIVTQKNADDLNLQDLVVVDPTSQQYMPGAEIDYVFEMIGAAFKIHNPLAKAACGCGTSFSI